VDAITRHPLDTLLASPAVGDAGRVHHALAQCGASNHSWRRGRANLRPPAPADKLLQRLRQSSTRAGISDNSAV
jgi:hypothetical protein